MLRSGRNSYYAPTDSRRLHGHDWQEDHCMSIFSGTRACSVVRQIRATANMFKYGRDTLCYVLSIPLWLSTSVLDLRRVTR
jgi:hypothetical protein